METLVAVATVPAVIALVTLAKDLGLPTRLAPLLAVVLGIGLTILDSLTTGSLNTQQDALRDVSTGLVLGLSAAGLYDGARLVASAEKPKRASEE